MRWIGMETIALSSLSLFTYTTVTYTCYKKTLACSEKCPKTHLQCQEDEMFIQEQRDPLLSMSGLLGIGAELLFLPRILQNK